MNKVVDENYYDLIINNVIVPSYDTGITLLTLMKQIRCFMYLMIEIPLAI